MLEKRGAAGRGEDVERIVELVLVRLASSSTVGDRTSSKRDRSSEQDDFDDGASPQVHRRFDDSLFSTAAAGVPRETSAWTLRECQERLARRRRRLRGLRRRCRSWVGNSFEGERM